MQAAGEHHLRLTPFWALAGLSAESTAVLFHPQIASALALHVAAAALLGFLASDGRPIARWPSLFVASALVFTLPVLGALGVCLLVVPGWRARRPAEANDVLELGMPEFDEREKPDAIGPIEVVLRMSDVPLERMAAVMALRRMDVQLAVPLLRVALTDTYEDVRLLAYAILDRREREVRGRIDRLLEELDALPATGPPADVAPRAAVLRALSELHWELVNSGFTSGELDARTLHAAIRYGHASLSLVPDGSLATLLARICIRCDKPHGARRYLRAADVLGVAHTALAPLYAEVAFQLRRFDAIARLFAHAGGMARPRLDAVVHFWATRGDA